MSIGNCNKCHGRHDFSIASVRLSEACGACHLGPDHSQLEIWKESQHGIAFNARRDKQDLSVPADEFTVKHNDAPTCATCHFSGLNSVASTHDTTERLSWYLYAPISKKRPSAQANRDRMKEVCSNCHASSKINNFYKLADQVVHATNKKVGRVKNLIQTLKNKGLMTPKPFDEELDFKYFDHWHYYGRTAKHGAFMGGADFVQWHGNYEMLLHEIEINKIAKDLLKHKSKR